MATTSLDNGLLDLKVEVSRDDLTSGVEFAVYVSVKNPFRSAIYIQRVTVNVPSEIELPQWDLLKQQEKEDTQLEDRNVVERAETQRRVIEEKVKNEERLDKLEEELGLIVFGLMKARREGDDERVAKLEVQRTQIEQEIKIIRQAIEVAEVSLTSTADAVFIVRGQVRNIATEGDAVVIVRENAFVGNVAIGKFVAEEHKSREVNLSSSLPEGSALQPGDTAVYTVILKSKPHLLYRPTQFKLVFNVAYDFGDMTVTRVNSVEKMLYVRAPIFSIVCGALLGGALGFVAKQLQVFSTLSEVVSAGPHLLLAFTLSLILSAVAVVFTARKSDIQSFVSVEDFWGGLVIGFLIGYSGVAAFQNYTNIAP